MKYPVKYHLQPQAVPKVGTATHQNVNELFTELVYNPEERWLTELQNVLVHGLGGHKGLCSACVYTPVSLLLRAWPKHSGNVVYPIPHPWLEPHEAFTSDLGGRLDASPYGKNRMDALLFLIELVQHCLAQKAKRNK